ncbi:MAG TPA: RsmD family RNA methyltransferase, partial [Bacillota bacterium]|nr:RsmD family RNA methyltransferase [Bacillota bacterium]
SSIALIKENISLCGASDRAFVLSGDFRNNIRRIKDEIDVYFIDPPYADGYIVPALEEIRSSGNLKPGGLVICEHSPKEHLPEFIEGYQLLKTRTYGASSVSVYEKTEE